MNANATVLGRLVRSEVSGRRWRAMVLLLVVVTLSSGALIVGLESQSRAGALWDNAFRRANGAHVTLNSSNVALMEKIAHDPRVAAATKPYPALEGVDIVSRTGREELLLRDMGANDLPPISHPLLREGRWVRTGSADEIVVERSYAIDRKINVGDRISVEQSGTRAGFTVVGEAVDLNDCFYPQCSPMPAWVDPAGFARFDTHTQSAYSSIFLRLRHPDRVDAFVTGILNRYGNRVGTDDFKNTRGDALTITGFFGAFLSGFGVFVMLAAALVVLGSMASRMVARRRDIGLLKSVGVTPRLMTAAVLVAHVTVAAVGVVSGWALAGFMTGRLQRTMTQVLGGGGASFPASRLLIALVVIECIVVAAIAVPAWRTGRLPTTAALSPVATAKSHRSRLARAGERLGVGPVGTSGLRDAFARPARSVFTVLALAIAIVAVVVSISFNSTVHRAFHDFTYTGDPYDLIAVPQTKAARASVATAMNATPGITSWFSTTGRRGVIKGSAYQTRALSGDVKDAGYRVGSGRMPTGPDEAIAGYGLLNALGVHVGDTITVEISGKPLTLRLVGWYSDTADGGKILMFPLSALQRVQPTAGPETFLAHVQDRSHLDAVAATLQRALDGKATVRTHDVQKIPQINEFQTTFLLVTLLVLVVAFTNLASTLLLAVRERTHDLGVLRSVGFTPRQVLVVTAIGAGVLAFVGVVVGIPLGWAAQRALLSIVGASAGIGPNIGVDPSLLLLFLLVPAAVVLGAGMGGAVSRRAATAEVSDLVRYE